MLVIYESLTDMNVEIWTEAPQFLSWEYINGIFFAVGGGPWYTTVAAP